MLRLKGDASFTGTTVSRRRHYCFFKKQWEKNAELFHWDKENHKCTVMWVSKDVGLFNSKSYRVLLASLQRIESTSLYLYENDSLAVRLTHVCQLSYYLRNCFLATRWWKEKWPRKCRPGITTASCTSYIIFDRSVGLCVCICVALLSQLLSDVSAKFRFIKHEHWD